MPVRVSACHIAMNHEACGGRLQRRWRPLDTIPPTDADLRRPWQARTHTSPKHALVQVLAPPRPSDQALRRRQRARSTSSHPDLPAARPSTQAPTLHPHSLGRNNLQHRRLVRRLLPAAYPHRVDAALLLCLCLCRLRPSIRGQRLENTLGRTSPDPARWKHARAFLNITPTRRSGWFGWTH